MAVFNEKHELVAVLSQSDIVRYLNTKLQFSPDKSEKNSLLFRSLAALCSVNLQEIAAMRDTPVRNLGLGERVVSQLCDLCSVCLISLCFRQIWTGHVPAVLQLRSDALVLDAIRNLAMTGAAVLAIVDPVSGAHEFLCLRLQLCFLQAN